MYTDSRRGIVSSLVSGSTTLRTLIAVSNRLSEKLMLRLFESIGYHADVMIDSTRFLSLIEEQGSGYDLVLMERQLLDITSTDAIYHIRQALPVQQQPYLVVMIAQDELADARAENHSIGVDYCIGKPVQSQDIQHVLKQAFGRKNSLRPMSVIDLTYLRDVIGVDQTLLHQYIHDFLHNSQETLQDLQHATHAQDSNLIEHYAHSLKGGCATLGAQQLVHLLYHMERFGLQRQFTQATEQFRRVEQEYQRVRVALQQVRY